MKHYTWYAFLLIVMSITTLVMPSTSEVANILHHYQEKVDLHKASRWQDTDYNISGKSTNLKRQTKPITSILMNDQNTPLVPVPSYHVSPLGTQVLMEYAIKEQSDKNFALVKTTDILLSKKDRSKLLSELDPNGSDKTSYIQKILQEIRRKIEAECKAIESESHTYESNKRLFFLKYNQKAPYINLDPVYIVADDGRRVVVSYAEFRDEKSQSRWLEQVVKAYPAKTVYTPLHIGAAMTALSAAGLLVYMNWNQINKFIQDAGEGLVGFDRASIKNWFANNEQQEEIQDDEIVAE